MAVPEEAETVSEEIEWTAENEVQLFHAMRGHKPVGVNKHFQMACIVEKFRNFVNKDISSKAIWDHLETMYDMQSLDDIENVPFPNEEREFGLPEAEFATMLEEKTKHVKVETQEEDSEIRRELDFIVSKSTKEVSIKKEGSNKEIKNMLKKEHRDSRDFNKDSKRESKESSKEIKRVSKEGKEGRRESKDGKEKREYRKSEGKETVKEGKKESIENKEVKASKPRGSIKEKREEDRDDASLSSLTPIKKDRVKELTDGRNEDSPKRGGKRSMRGLIKPDDAGSNKSSSPVTAPTPPPHKRRRT